jgi:plastocyanin
MYNRIIRIFTSILTIAMVLLTSYRVNAATQSPAHHWYVDAGAGAPTSSVTAMKFYPSIITINEGDSITWRVKGDAHTIGFLSGATPPIPGSPESLNPIGGTSYDGSGIISSGLVEPHGSYTLMFTHAGTFDYQCLIHPSMHGQVVVNPAGTPYPTSQLEYNREARSLESQDIFTGIDLLSSNKVTPPSLNNDGTQTFYAKTGMGIGDVAIMRFLPGVMFIHVNDSITWTNEDPMDPHTVTFPGSATDIPELPDPAAFVPIGGTSFDGIQLTSSGLLSPKGAPGTNSYTLKFTEAGQFAYECLLHDEIGMKGTVIVLK